MNKNAKIITLVLMIMVIVAASVITVIILATTHGDQMSSNGFVVITNGNEATISSYTGTDKTILVPSTINGKKVVGVGANAFKGKTIESIEFSDKIKKFEVEDNAFVGINEIKYIKLPQGTTRIGDNAFKDLRYLSHITMPDSIKSIGEYAFSGCRALLYSNNQEKEKIFRFPSSLISIGAYAFQDAGFETAIFNDKLETIGEAAFLGCELADVTVGENNTVKSIGKKAFYSTRIKSTVDKPLNFPHLESIGEYAFSDITSNFYYFKLGAKVHTISEYAFANNTSLDEVEFDPNIKISTFGKGAFSGDTRLQKISLTGDKSNTSEVRSTFPDSITVIPELAFNGCYRLLNDRDFVIGAKIDTIGDGAFSIYDYNYDSKLSYTKRVIKIAEENERFKVTKLDNFLKEGAREEDKVHYVLTNYSETELIAYLGKYDQDSYRAVQEEPNGNETKLTAFRFLSSSNNTLKDHLSTIRGYAFAGVKFTQFVAIPGIKKIGAYAFKGSNVSTVFIENKECIFDEKAFTGMPDDTSIASDNIYLSISSQLNAMMNADNKLKLNYVTMELGTM